MFKDSFWCVKVICVKQIKSIFVNMFFCIYIYMHTETYIRNMHSTTQEICFLDVRILGLSPEC